MPILLVLLCKNIPDPRMKHSILWKFVLVTLDPGSREHHNQCLITPSRGYLPRKWIVHV